MAVAIIGAGLAGLVAALSLAEHGVEAVLFERASEPGGTSILSSGWIWRYCDLDTFAWGAPHGDRALQRTVWEALPDELVWLERQGARRVATGTDSPHTEGVRLDIGQTIDALVRRLPADVLRCDEQVVSSSRTAEGIRLFVRRQDAPPDAPLRPWDVEQVVFASGGYAADHRRIAAESAAAPDAVVHWARRNSGLSDGSGLDVALALGALRVPVSGETYARAMPVGVEQWTDDYVHFSHVEREHAAVVDGSGGLVERAEHDWSASGVMWQVARRGGRGWYLLDREALGQRTPHGGVLRSVQDAKAAGAEVLEAGRDGLGEVLEDELGTELTALARVRAREAVCAIAVRPGLTHTMCGLRIRPDARVLVDTPRRSRLPGGARPAAPDLLAAGVEAGGIGNGGYASGLAQGLVLGRIAAATAAARG